MCAYCAIIRNMDTSPDLEPPSLPIHLCDWLKPLTSVPCALLESGKKPTVDQLDALQTELKEWEETITQRVHSIGSELAVLSDVSVKREQAKSKRKMPEREATSHRSTAEPKPAKKRRTHTDTPPPLSRVEDKSQHKEPSTALSSKPSKGDSLERLWSSVEVFCRDITELDLQQLREYMSKDSKLFDIPPLGEHYARQWATGDLESEQEAALSGTTEGSREDPLYRRLDKPPMKPSSDPLGPLTQRLVAAFVEEGLSTQRPTQLQPLNSKAATLLHGCHDNHTLEQCLKEELLALGILDLEEEEEKESDEVLTELQSKQNELRVISEMNRKRLRQLYSAAQVEMKRQATKAKLEEVDKDIAKWLQVMQNAKQRRRHVSERDRESAWRAVERRRELVAEMEASNESN